MKHRIKGLFLIVLAFFALVGWMALDDAAKKTASGKQRMTSTSIHDQPKERREVLRVLADKLARVFKEHPKTEISETFGKMIGRGEIALFFVELEGQSASIAIVRTDRGDKLTLCVHPDVIERLPQTKQYLELVIYHEWIHVKQFMDKQIPGHLLMPNVDLRDEEEAALHFRTEFEAYEAECRFAQNIGTSLYAEVCVAYEAGGRAGLANWLVSALARNDSARFLSVFVKEAARLIS